VSSQPGAFPSISAAIAAAHGESVIVVTPGEHAESLAIAGGPLALGPAEGPDTVVIDGSSLRHPAVLARRVVRARLQRPGRPMPGREHGRSRPAVRTSRHVAGYTDETTGFLDADPGLGSRSAKTTEFDEYADDELVTIVCRIAEAADRHDEPAGEAITHYFATLPRDRDFGHDRGARRLFERMRQARAQRLRAVGRRPAPDALRRLTATDVTVATRGR
jgi:hypothetical protein